MQFTPSPKQEELETLVAQVERLAAEEELAEVAEYKAQVCPSRSTSFL